MRKSASKSNETVKTKPPPRTAPSPKVSFNRLRLPSDMKIPSRVELKPSTVDEKTLGVWSKRPIKKGEEFGPFMGKKVMDATDEMDSSYVWEIVDKETKEFLFYIDATDLGTSNWMRYINCARHFDEQNIISEQIDVDIFYKVIKDISPGEELLTWYKKPKLRRKNNRKRQLNCATASGSAEKTPGKVMKLSSPRKDNSCPNVPDRPNVPARSKVKVEDAMKRERETPEQDVNIVKTPPKKSLKLSTTHVPVRRRRSSHAGRKADRRVPTSVVVKPDDGQLEQLINGCFQFSMKDYNIVRGRSGRRLYRCDICASVYRHAFSLKRHYIRSHVNFFFISEMDRLNCNVTPPEGYGVRGERVNFAAGGDDGLPGSSLDEDVASKESWFHDSDGVNGEASGSLRDSDVDEADGSGKCGSVQNGDGSGKCGSVQNGDGSGKSGSVKNGDGSGKSGSMQNGDGSGKSGSMQNGDGSGKSGSMQNGDGSGKSGSMQNGDGSGKSGSMQNGDGSGKSGSMQNGDGSGKSGSMQNGDGSGKSGSMQNGDGSGKSGSMQNGDGSGKSGSMQHADDCVALGEPDSKRRKVQCATTESDGVDADASTAGDVRSSESPRVAKIVVERESFGSSDVKFDEASDSSYEKKSIDVDSEPVDSKPVSTTEGNDSSSGAPSESNVGNKARQVDADVTNASCCLNQDENTKTPNDENGAAPDDKLPVSSNAHDGTKDDKQSSTSETVTNNSAPVTSPPVEGSSMTSAAVVGSSVTSAPVKDSSVTSAAVEDSSVTSAPVEDSSVTSAPVEYISVNSTPVEDSSVTSAPVKDSSVTSAPVKDSSVTSAPVEDSSVTSAPVKDSSVISASVKDSSVTSAPVEDSSVTSAPIEDSSVTSAPVEDSSLTSAPIEDSSVTSAPVEDSSLTSAPIVDSSVTSASVEDSSVTSAPVKDSSVTSAPVEDSSVTSAPVEDSSVTSAPVKDSSVTSASVEDSSVTRAPVADSSETSVPVKDSSVTSAPIEDGSVTSAPVEYSSVTSAPVKDSSVTSAPVEDSSVTSAPVEDSSVTSAPVEDSSVTSAPVKDSSVTSAPVEDSSVTSAPVEDSSVTSAPVEDSSVNSAPVKDSSVTSAPVDEISLPDKKPLGNNAADENCDKRSSAQDGKNICTENNTRDTTREVPSTDLGPEAGVSSMDHLPAEGDDEHGSGAGTGTPVDAVTTDVNSEHDDARHASDECITPDDDCDMFNEPEDKQSDISFVASVDVEPSGDAAAHVGGDGLALVYRCHVCQCHLVTKLALKRHLVEHSRDNAGEESPAFACDECDMAFLSVQNLARHKTVHSGEKPFPCRYCHKKFPTVTNQRRHERIHQGRRFCCGHCQRTFTQTGDLKKHVGKLHPELFHECVLCGKYFSSDDLLEEHLGSHGNGVRHNWKAVSVERGSHRANLELDRAESMKLATVKSGASFACTVCQKPYGDYANMCRHRRLAHQCSSLLNVRNGVKVESGEDFALSDYDESEDAFYAHVAENISDNLTNFLEGKKVHLDNCYDHINEKLRPSCQPAAVKQRRRRRSSADGIRFNVAQYNFPKTFRLRSSRAIESCDEQHGKKEHTGDSTEQTPALVKAAVDSVEVKRETADVELMRVPRVRQCVQCTRNFHTFKSYREHMYVRHKTLVPDDANRSEDWLNDQPNSPPEHSRIAAPLLSHSLLSNSPDILGVNKSKPTCYSGWKNGLLTGVRKDAADQEPSELLDSCVLLIPDEEPSKEADTDKPFNYKLNLVAKCYICNVCNEQFGCLDLLVDHQSSLHPNVYCTHLEVDIDGRPAAWLQMAPVGLLHVTTNNIPAVEDFKRSTKPKFRCTKCNKTSASMLELHTHIAECAAEGKDVIVPVPMVKKSTKYKVKTIKGRKKAPLAMTPGYEAFYGDERVASHDSAQERHRKKRRKNFELLYNPLHHVRRRELTQVLEIHNCGGCHQQFKTISLLERHVRVCSQKDKLKEMRAMSSSLDANCCDDDDDDDEYAYNPNKHMCIYCLKQFTYFGTLRKHVSDWCQVRTDFVEHGDLLDDEWEESLEVKGSGRKKEGRLSRQSSFSSLNGRDVGEGTKKGAEPKWKDGESSMDSFREQRRSMSTSEDSRCDATDDVESSRESTSYKQETTSDCLKQGGKDSEPFSCLSRPNGEFEELGKSEFQEEKKEGESGDDSTGNDRSEFTKNITDVKSEEKVDDSENDRSCDIQEQPGPSETAAVVPQLENRSSKAELKPEGDDNGTCQIVQSCDVPASPRDQLSSQASPFKIPNSSGFAKVM